MSGWDFLRTVGENCAGHGFNHVPNDRPAQFCRIFYGARVLLEDAFDLGVRRGELSHVPIAEHAMVQIRKHRDYNVFVALILHDTKQQLRQGIPGPLKHLKIKIPFDK